MDMLSVHKVVKPILQPLIHSDTIKTTYEVVKFVANHSEDIQNIIYYTSYSILLYYSPVATLLTIGSKLK